MLQFDSLLTLTRLIRSVFHLCKGALVTSLQEKKMLPAIVFLRSVDACNSLAIALMDYLEAKEEACCPKMSRTELKKKEKLMKIISRQTNRQDSAKEGYFLFLSNYNTLNITIFPFYTLCFHIPINLIILFLHL